MPAQRSRRQYLRHLGSLGVVGAAGCVGTGSSVSLLAAGSLAQAVEDHIAPAFESKTGTAVHGEYFGSKALLRMVADRVKHPDVVLSADATLLRDRLYTDFATWDVEFATNVIGLGYRRATPIGRAVSAGTPWYEALRRSKPGAVLISDPDLDPLGYRALLAFELAERAHDLDGFRATAEAVVAEAPDETRMLTQVATGSRAAAVCYRNMALDHDLPFLEFPPAYNFASPDLAAHYRTAVVHIGDDGQPVRGRPILYAGTVLEDAAAPSAGRRLLQFLTDNPGVVGAAGLAVGESLPRGHGSLPAALE